MPSELPESDWKVFRELRELALQRFCKRVLDELPRFREGAAGSYHDRYRDAYEWLQERDRELAQAFDDPARSRMRLQLAAIQRLGLLEPDELGRFTPRTREAIESLAQARSRS